MFTYSKQQIIFNLYNFSLQILCILSLQQNYPIVLIHGLSETNESLADMKSWIEQTLNTYVLDVQIGNREKIDTVLMPLEDQLAYVRDAIYNDPNLKSGYILVGYSNGGYLGRMMLEQYQSQTNEWKMVRFVSLHGPLGGFFCGTESICYTYEISEQLSQLAAEIVYTDFIQDTIAEAQYWRDPYNLDNYYEGCKGLPYLDNIHQEQFNQTYKDNFMSVDYHVLFGGPNDGAISPWISTFYGTWANNTDSEIIDLTQRDVYIHDTFGLKSMYESGKVILVQDDIYHTDVPRNKDFIINQVCPYLVKDIE